MKVTFRTNLGSRDAVELGLDHHQCTIGASVEVDDRTAESLAARGLVDPLPPKIKSVPKPAKIKGVEEAVEKIEKVKEGN